LAKVAEADAADLGQVEPPVVVSRVRWSLVQDEILRREADVDPLVLRTPEPARIVAAARLLLTKNDDYRRRMIRLDRESQPIKAAQITVFQRKHRRAVL